MGEKRKKRRFPREKELVKRERERERERERIVKSVALLPPPLSVGF